MQPVKIVTISREFGAGGSELARALGDRLGWPVLDRDLIHLVAERLRLDDATIEFFDEHPPSLLARIATVLIMPQPEMYSFPPTSDLTDHDGIATATTQVIRDAAERAPIIIVGHGAQCIFEGRRDVLNVRVVASAESRIDRIARRMHVDRAHAAMLLRRADQDRQAYVQRYFHRDWHSELLYDARFNTGRISIDECAGMVARLVELRGG